MVRVDARVCLRHTTEGEEGIRPADGPRHWLQTRDAKGIHWLTLDRVGSRTNTLSGAVLNEFETLLAGIEADLPRGLIIQSAKPTGFIAGADIREFVQFQNIEQVKERVLYGQALFNRLEALPIPTVALIHGFCLGGGLELALACRYRIADEGARLGLPEVKLGIHPGWGGTPRLTRLLPAITALELILTGRTLEAEAAKQLGLVDVVTERSQLTGAARQAILDGLKAKRGGLKVALLNSAPVRWVLAHTLRRKLAARVRPEHYPAPYALIDIWRRDGGDPERLQQAEADSVAPLLLGDTAQNLIRVFFLRERLKALGRDIDFPIRYVHVIGAGVMGGDIAAWSALQGLTVTLQDRSPELLDPAVRRAADLFGKQLKDEAKVREALERLIPDHHGTGLARADVVIEAIYEDLQAKQDLYRRIEPHLKPEILLATNTSSIPLEKLAQALVRPQRLVGLHFFNPVAKMPLVEAIRGDATDTAIFARTKAFARRIDRLPLPVRSSPGFLVNRVLMPYLMEAIVLVEEGVQPAAIDAAAKAFGMPMGPLELADRVGLDICLQVGDILARELGGEVPDRLRELVEQGHKGCKTGQGFYRYWDGKPQKSRVKDGGDPELQDRLLLPMLNECVACLREGVAADADLVDAAMIFGTGFAPFRGGPIQYLKKRGRDELLRRLGELEQRYGKRFHPDLGWESVLESVDRETA